MNELILAKQCYVSTSLNQFKERFKNKYNLSDYTNNKEPAIFFGVYNMVDIEKIKHHNSHRYIIFGGSDVNFNKAINILRKLNNITFLSISHDIEDRLNNKKIKNIYIEFSLLDTTIFKPISKEELGNSIFIYNGYYKNLEHNYGKEYYEKVMKLLPNYNYIFSNNLNESYENMPNIYKQCFIILRLTKNDGNANTIQEAQALGIPSIHNQSDYGLKWNTVDDIINYINKYSNF